MRVLIADDEMATREGIRSLVPWNQFDVQEVQTAPDGEKALALAREFRPHIIISDVRMLKISGLEFAEEIRKILPYCQIIFISGYSDKEYLKKAIRLNVVSYIEKPIEIAELLSAISTAISAYKRDAQLRSALAGTDTTQSQTVFGLISDDPASYRHFLPEAFQNAGQYVSMLVFVKGGVPQQKQTESQKVLSRMISASIGSCIWHSCPKRFRASYLFHIGLSNGTSADLSSQLPEILQTIHRNEKPFLFLSLGKPVSSIEQIRESYLSAEEASTQLFFRGFGFVASATSTEKALRIPDSYTNISEEFETYLKGSDLDCAVAVIERFYRSANSGAATDIPFIQETFLRFLLLIYQMSVERGRFPQENSPYLLDIQNFFQKSTLYEIKQYVEDQTYAYFRGIPDSSQRKITNEIIRYIEKNYQDHTITVESIANAVHLTTSHISHLFKDDTGRTIKQYLAEYRIDVSRQLLKDRQTKLSEVARLSGFVDANYFTKIFRRHVGMTPSEYREKFLL